ncbi:KaiC domain-containing protein [Halobellus ruber]|uniref:KaiC domain-containing protein n=1 Tax=Halobellus ruber TaxID=2761102 RepID=A0A7J9SDI5_9EURY|nr:KaiC domain-containing protein [Halobellus ruber]
MSDDDDWFERALREGENGEDAGSEGAGPDAGDPDAGSASTPDAEDAEPTVGDSDAEDAEPTVGHPAGESGDGGDDSDGTAAASAGGTDDGSDADDSRGDDADTGDRGVPFDRDFASALEDAPDPGSGVGGSQPGGSGGTGPFGGGSGGESPSDGSQGDGAPFGGSGEGQDAGDSPFGGDEFGFGDVGGEDPESFDEAEFESDLERLDIGIEGLDQMILGGVPQRSLMVAIGSAGTGKTTFGLQFLNHGLQQGEDAVYITLEESFDRIVSTADEKGWGFGEYVDEDRLAVVDIDPIEMANSLDSIQNDLPNLIEDFGADRLVLDSVSLLEMMYESAPQRRSQVFGFARSLKEAGITILLTSEADRNHAYASRFGIVEYLADAVFVLQYVRPSDFRETRLAIEIQKIRDANHSRETKPYDLTDEGISVYRQANIF